MEIDHDKRLNELIDKYKAMRIAQAAYFAQKRVNNNPKLCAYKDVSSLLDAARKLEKECDALVKQIMAEQAESKQPKLNV